MKSAFFRKKEREKKIPELQKYNFKSVQMNERKFFKLVVT